MRKAFLCSLLSFSVLLTACGSSPDSSNVGKTVEEVAKKEEAKSGSGQTDSLKETNWTKKDNISFSGYTIGVVLPDKWYSYESEYDEDDYTLHSDLTAMDDGGEILVQEEDSGTVVETVEDASYFSTKEFSDTDTNEVICDNDKYLAILISNGAKGTNDGTGEDEKTVEHYRRLNPYIVNVFVKGDSHYYKFWFGFREECENAQFENIKNPYKIDDKEVIKAFINSLHFMKQKDDNMHYEPDFGEASGDEYDDEYDDEY